MNQLEMRLLEALQALEVSIRPRPAGSTAVDVRPHLSELDRLTRELPTDADPQLVHFLRRRSYEKARLFLEGRGPEIHQGGCLRSVE